MICTERTSWVFKAIKAGLGKGKETNDRSARLVPAILVEQVAGFHQPNQFESRPGQARSESLPGPLGELLAGRGWRSRLKCGEDLFLHELVETAKIRDHAGGFVDCPLHRDEEVIVIGTRVRSG